MKLSLIIILFIIALTTNVAFSARKRQSKSNLEIDDEDVEVVTSEEQLKTRMKELKQNYNENEITLEELEKLQKEEAALRKNVLRVGSSSGHFSDLKAQALHKLGGNLFRQEKFSEVLNIAKEIVQIHEKKDGVEHPNTAKALGNLASVAFRLNDFKTCHYAMRRGLYILLKEFTESSKEIMMQRGKMLTFQVPNAEKDKGLSHKQYLEELEYDQYFTDDEEDL